jgi:uncharacterized protein YegJ (DUF2314 family)
VFLAFIMGCDRTEPASDPTPNDVATRPLRWESIEGATLVALPTEGEDPEMDAAIAQAQATAEQARQHWTDATGDDRDRWAVKWAAPSTDGRIEHVWVRPESWSSHRIEGTLLSPPVTNLLCGRVRGESVSFPLAELTDWLHAPAPGSSLPPEGGFTVRLLEQRYGDPAGN